MLRATMIFDVQKSMFGFVSGCRNVQSCILQLHLWTVRRGQMGLLVAKKLIVARCSGFVVVLRSAVPGKSGERSGRGLVGLADEGSICIEHDR